MLLEPGLDLTLRPMRYPGFYEMYRDAIKNTWTVEEVDFSTDIVGAASPCWKGVQPESMQTAIPRQPRKHKPE